MKELHNLVLYFNSLLTLDVLYYVAVFFLPTLLPNTRANPYTKDHGKLVSALYDVVSGQKLKSFIFMLKVENKQLLDHSFAKDLLSWKRKDEMHNQHQEYNKHRIENDWLTAIDS